MNVCRLHQTQPTCLTRSKEAKEAMTLGRVIRCLQVAQGYA